ERELGCGSGPHQLVGTVREVVLQEQVEAGDHRGERKPDRRHDGDEQAPADASWERDAAHRSTYPTPCTVVIDGALSSAPSLRRRRATYASRVLSWTIAPCGQPARIRSRLRTVSSGRVSRRARSRNSVGVSRVESVPHETAWVIGSRRRPAASMAPSAPARRESACRRATTSAKANGFVT